jgi:hypothetical protein
MSNNTELISINNNLLKRQDGDVLGAPPFPGMGSFRLNMMQNYPSWDYGIVLIKMTPKCDFHLASWEIADASSIQTPERLIGSGFILNDTIEVSSQDQLLGDFIYETFNTVTLTKIADGNEGGIWAHDNYLVRYSRNRGPVLLEAGKTYYLNVSGPMHDSIDFPIGYKPAKTLTGFEYRYLQVVDHSANSVYDSNAQIITGGLMSWSYRDTRPYLKLVDSQGRVIYS